VGFTQGTPLSTPIKQFLDWIFKRIYEDMVSDRLTAERFDKLSIEYELEQKQVKQTILELQE